MNKQEAVKQFAAGFFGSADPELMKVLDTICRHRTAEKKSILFVEGQEGSTVYFLVKGSIKLFRTNDEGREAVVHFVRSGEIFAEILLQLGLKYPVTSMTLEECELLEIDAHRLEEVISKDPKVSMKLIGALSKRIKYFVNLIESLTVNDVRARLVNWLKSQKKKESAVVKLPVPKGELALLLGTTAETFSRILKKLQEEGYIEVQGREIKILKNLE
ncbi:Crp/Fnr family transcriptional regulator [Seleniivibrio sp.]|uniref:Crp/Fnr family transcriptional regulator n=1 Tax=Seleniivibrio sp. TaxID=2898801 RepID=UPI0025F3B654|nr:Crp/Fnr family transcriptional regulator [Seleniivibrio sp.]MCD8554037.1 Crp/Fnr family transcriptional regulator [Seleniivibrio sp.]